MLCLIASLVTSHRFFFEPHTVGLFSLLNVLCDCLTVELVSHHDLMIVLTIGSEDSVLVLSGLARFQFLNGRVYNT